MSRVSKEFGALIRKILDDNGLTFRAAGLRTSISAAYWKDMTDGRVPTEEVIDRISAEFREPNINELRVAAGYCTKPDSTDAVTAVEFALRGQKDIPEEGKRQILDLVRNIEENNANKAK